MSARFNSSGQIVVDAGSVGKVKLSISWNDKYYEFGLALTKAVFSGEDGDKTWELPGTNPSEASSLGAAVNVSESGNADKTITVNNPTTASKTYSCTYQIRTITGYVSLFPVFGNTFSSANVNKKNDNKIVFYDQNGTDANATIDLTFTADTTVVPPGEVVPPPPPPDPVVCPTPTPWESILPTCGSAPSGISSVDGLQISKTGSSQITLNLKNYPNQLVTLKVTHQATGSWTQGFGFNVAKCSDVSPSNVVSGGPYSKSPYSNSAISGTNIFYLYNLDGGNYNYTFDHTSVPGPRPTRTNWIKKSYQSCSTDSEGNETCVTVEYCEAYTETYDGAWPHCTVEVAVSKNGGSEVQWQYEDGSGGNYDDQYVTVEVVSVRNAISFSGPVCTSALKGNVWVPDVNQPGAVGNCISDYLDYSDKIRYRIPTLASSQLTLDEPLCSSAFRGIAGAIPPGSEQGSTSGQYSILHIFDEDSNTNTSLYGGNGVTIEASNLNDEYNSPYNESDPSSNLNLGTLERRYYTVTFTDDTVVNTGASNITITVGQNVLADGTTSGDGISVYKKEQVTANSLRVWFYTSLEAQVPATDDIVHVFDDSTNQTTTGTGGSELAFDTVFVIPEEETDPGNQTTGFETLDALNKKHYTIVFTDGTVVEPDGTNIIIVVDGNKTASNITAAIQVSKKEKLDDSTLRVWFTAYYTTNPPGKEKDNAFVRTWSIARTRSDNLSGNVFVRNWYLSKSV